MRRLIVLAAVAISAYYAGYQQLTFDDFQNWLDEQNVLEIIESTGKDMVDFANEHEITEKAGEAIVDLKEKVSN